MPTPTTIPEAEGNSTTTTFTNSGGLSIGWAILIALLVATCLLAAVWYWREQRAARKAKKKSKIGSTVLQRNVQSTSQIYSDDIEDRDY